jgi:phospholipid/cholesterol/gamma-HCH transport system ATP-binding protein
MQAAVAETYNSIQKSKKERVITIRNLKKAFGNNVVLNGFDLDLYRGENVVVIGKSGSGKSVLIKCIIGLLTPDDGSIDVLGIDVAHIATAQLDMIRAKVGFLFQSNALYDSMTVKENLEFPLRRHWEHLSSHDAEELVLEALENVGLEHTINMMPVELSGGMKKRIALARTLILKPEIILYDEPTTGLDPVTGKEISELIVAIQKKYNTSSLIITHDMSCVRITANKIILLVDGKCGAFGTMDELKKSDEPHVKEFFESVL